MAYVTIINDGPLIRLPGNQQSGPALSKVTGKMARRTSKTPSRDEPSVNTSLQLKCTQAIARLIQLLIRINCSLEIEVQLDAGCRSKLCAGPRVFDRRPSQARYKTREPAVISPSNGAQWLDGAGERTSYISWPKIVWATAARVSNAGETQITQMSQLSLTRSLRWASGAVSKHPIPYPGPHG